MNEKQVALLKQITEIFSARETFANLGNGLFTTTVAAADQRLKELCNAVVETEHQTFPTSVPALRGALLWFVDIYSGRRTSKIDPKCLAAAQEFLAATAPAADSSGTPIVQQP